MNKSRYQFCNEIFLTYDELGYHVLIGDKTADESQYTSGQLKNPLVAYQRFTSEINKYFYHKISEYIHQTGRKRGMGCKSTICSCADCIKQGYNTADSECYFTEEQAEKIIERSNKL